MCAMRRKTRKGFTIVELVMTIAILGVSTALTVLVIANVTNIQRSSTNQFVYSKQLKAIDDIANDYVSFVSLNNSAVDFNYVTDTTSSITFKCDDYLYILSYSNHIFGITNNYDGADEYFAKTENANVDVVDDVVFSYYPELGQLVLTVKINDVDNHLSYIFRGEL